MLSHRQINKIYSQYVRVFYGHTKTDRKALLELKNDPALKSFLLAKKAYEKAVTEKIAQANFLKKIFYRLVTPKVDNKIEIDYSAAAEKLAEKLQALVAISEQALALNSGDKKISEAPSELDLKKALNKFFISYQHNFNPEAIFNAVLFIKKRCPEIAVKNASKIIQDYQSKQEIIVQKIIDNAKQIADSTVASENERYQQELNSANKTFVAYSGEFIDERLVYFKALSKVGGDQISARKITSIAVKPIYEIAFDAYEIASKPTQKAGESNIQLLQQKVKQFKEQYNISCSFSQITRIVKNSWKDLPDEILKKIKSLLATPTETKQASMQELLKPTTSPINITGNNSTQRAQPVISEKETIRKNLEKELIAQIQKAYCCQITKQSAIEEAKLIILLERCRDFGINIDDEKYYNDAAKKYFTKFFSLSTQNYSSDDLEQIEVLEVNMKIMSLKLLEKKIEILEEAREYISKESNPSDNHYKKLIENINSCLGKTASYDKSPSQAPVQQPPNDSQPCYSSMTP